MGGVTTTAARRRRGRGGGRCALMLRPPGRGRAAAWRAATYSVFSSMPSQSRPSSRATSPTVPVPKNGSSTTPGRGAAGEPAARSSRTSRSADCLSPGFSTIAADQGGAGRQDRAADQLGREGGEVRSAEAPGGDAPHVAGVLAERMAGQPGRSGAAQAVLAAGKRSRPCGPSPQRRPSRPGARRGVGLADGVEVEVVPRRAHEQVERLPGQAQPVPDG